MISCEVGAAKPYPEIYTILFEQLDATPSEILFIDDKEENLEAARALGWQTIYYDFRHYPHEELMSEFKRFRIDSRQAIIK